MRKLRRMDFTKMDSEGRERTLVGMSSGEERTMFETGQLQGLISVILVPQSCESPLKATKPLYITQPLSTKGCLSQW